MAYVFYKGVQIPQMLQMGNGDTAEFWLSWPDCHRFLVRRVAGDWRVYHDPNAIGRRGKPQPGSRLVAKGFKEAKAARSWVYMKAASLKAGAVVPPTQLEL